MPHFPNVDFIAFEMSKYENEKTLFPFGFSSQGPLPDFRCFSKFLGDCPRNRVSTKYIYNYTKGKFCIIEGSKNRFLH